MRYASVGNRLHWKQASLHLLFWEHFSIISTLFLELDDNVIEAAELLLCCP